MDERREIRLVCDVEEDGQDPEHELDREELVDVTWRRPDDRDVARMSARAASPTMRMASAHAVDPHAGRQGEEDEWEEAEDGDERELDWARVQADGGDDGIASAEICVPSSLID